jgi:drug/metabolite transporter (DMT)-like permease
MKVKKRKISKKEKRQNTKHYKLAILAFIIANIIWGAAPPIYKWSFADVQPYTLAFIRFIIPTLLIAIFAGRYIKIRLKHLPLLVAVGLCDITFNVGLSFFAITKTESINSPIIGSAGPIFLILGSMFLFREKPTKKLLLGNLIGLTGVLLIVMQPLLQSSHKGAVIGNAILIIATISSTCGTLLSKKARPYYHPLTVLFWSFFIGSLTFLPLFLFEVGRYGFLPHLTLQGITGIIYATGASSIIGYFFYYWAVKYILASDISVFSYVDPVIAVIIAAPLLHEYPTVIFFLGALMVLMGIFLAEGRIHYHPIQKLFQDH